MCIGLKSFYASVRCVGRDLNPFRDCLVVAGPDRSGKAICLAITLVAKALGTKSRCGRSSYRTAPIMSWRRRTCSAT